MGSQNSKDGFIDIFIQTNQPYFTAGDYVSGVVHVDCKSRRNYKTLLLKLMGVQYVHWSEGSGKHRRTYSNKKQTYLGAFELAIFAEGIVAAGNYSFPFRFLLPAEMPGSYFASQSQYIRYPLVGQLVAMHDRPNDDGKADNQKYIKNLNVLEPIRSPFGMVQKQISSAPQCCGRCIKYGLVNMSMTCDKNFVRSGDTIQVSGYVDNSAGKQNIIDCKISFEDIRWKVASSGAIRQHVISSNQLFALPSIIPKGQHIPFNFTARIPQGLVYSTAIGSILARYQTLKLTCSIGCCTMSPTCQTLLIFHTNSQKIQLSPTIPPPLGWNPIVANEVLQTNLPPYHYMPNQNMPVLNRSGVTNISQLGMMNNQTGYLENNNKIFEPNTFAFSGAEMF